MRSDIRDLWVPEILRTSCDLLVLVDQPSDPVVSLDAVRLCGRVLGEWSEGSGLAESAVRPVAVVVLFKFAKHDRGMSLVDDQDAVEEFARTVPTKRSGIALVRGARAGVLMMRTSVAAKTASNAVVTWRRGRG